jgi:hypothetical protein
MQGFFLKALLLVVGDVGQITLQKAVTGGRELFVLYGPEPLGNFLLPGRG